MILLLLACTQEPAKPTPAPAPRPAAQPATPAPALPPGVPPGAIVQDPTGYPTFHATPPPPGPAPAADPKMGKAVVIADAPLGGFRPQIVVGADNTLHVVYYDHAETGDILWYRSSKDGHTWATPEQISPSDGRNWGPDLAVTPDGRVYVAWDRAEADFRSRGWLRERGPDGWNEAVPLTEEGKAEVGSGHIAVVGSDIAYVYIGKPLGMEHRFRSHWRWRKGGVWSEDHTWTDGAADTWHANVQARPDGSVLAGYDVGSGGSETTVYVVNGKDGSFSAPENISLTSHPGERVHFGFGPDGNDWLTWFHKVGGLPRHVYVRGGHPGAWGKALDLAHGFGGYHYDPFVAVSPQNVPCVVWGWDGGAQAELVYSTYKDGRWAPPQQAAALSDGKPELPSMDVDSTGRFHVVWANGDRGRTRIWYTTITP